jgi:hypothetical protein
MAAPVPAGMAIPEKSIPQNPLLFIFTVIHPIVIPQLRPG